MEKNTVKIPPNHLNVGTFKHITEVEGPGKRFALWVQGCPYRCPGCCNPHLLEFKENKFTPILDIFNEILSVSDKIEGVTFIGGEPFAQAVALASLAEMIQNIGLSVMIFTGHKMSLLKNGTIEGADDLIRFSDIIVDGRFVQKSASMNRRYIGSDNQNIHILSDKYKHLIDNWPSGDDGIEFTFQNNELIINGYPHPDITKLIQNGLKFV